MSFATRAQSCEIRAVKSIHVMAGLVPAIRASCALPQRRRGCAGTSPAHDTDESSSSGSPAMPEPIQIGFISIFPPRHPARLHRPPAGSSSRVPGRADPSDRQDHGAGSRATRCCRSCRQRLCRLSALDVICVPGGFGPDALITDEGRSTPAQAVEGRALVTSVCTGSLLLGPRVCSGLSRDHALVCAGLSCLCRRRGVDDTRRASIAIASPAAASRPASTSA